MGTLALLLAIFISLQPAAEARAPLTVSAAVSLSQVLEEAARAYEAAGGGPVRFNFAGSNVLARQLAAGAPVDLFVSADEAQMRVAEVAGAIDVSSRVTLAGGRMAIVVRRGGPDLRDVNDLMSPSFRRIAIGDPAAVPAGVYARGFLEGRGLWTPLQRKLVPVGNVRAALAAAASGSVDAAFVYETDARVSRDVRVALLLSGPDAPRIVFPAALTSASRRRAAAARFLDFLRGEQAAAIFRRHGFIVAGERR